MNDNDKEAWDKIRDMMVDDLMLLADFANFDLSGPTNPDIIEWFLEAPSCDFMTIMPIIHGAAHTLSAVGELDQDKLRDLSNEEIVAGVLMSTLMHALMASLKRDPS